jgi:hypothetical protein
LLFAQFLLKVRVFEKEVEIFVTCSRLCQVLADRQTEKINSRPLVSIDKLLNSSPTNSFAAGLVNLRDVSV